MLPRHQPLLNNQQLMANDVARWFKSRLQIPNTVSQMSPRYAQSSSGGSAASPAARLALPAAPVPSPSTLFSPRHSQAIPFRLHGVQCSTDPLDNDLIVGSPEQFQFFRRPGPPAADVLGEVLPDGLLSLLFDQFRQQRDRTPGPLGPGCIGLPVSTKSGGRCVPEFLMAFCSWASS